MSPHLLALAVAAHALTVGSILVGRSDADGADAAAAEQRNMLASFAEVEQDLEVAKEEDDSSLQQLDGQIVALARQRDVRKRDEARKSREIAFLHAEIARLESKVGARQGSAARQVAGQAEEQSAASGAATASAAAGAGGAAAARAGAAAGASSDDTDAAAAAAIATVERAGASTNAAQARAKSSSSSGKGASAVETKAFTEAEATAKSSLSSGSGASAVKTKALTEAEVEEKMRKKIEQEMLQKKQAEEDRKRLEEEKRKRALEAEQKRKDSIADSADDSFKEFMKEEDGEDQMGDADYEESANALAGAIGWNRKEIESKADTAVKQLTEAIGGKKVVRSLQGMMSGIR